MPLSQGTPQTLSQPTKTTFPLGIGEVFFLLVSVQDQKKGATLECNRHQSRAPISGRGQRGEDKIVPLFTDQFRA